MQWGWDVSLYAYAGTWQIHWIVSLKCWYEYSKQGRILDQLHITLPYFLNIRTNQRDNTYILPYFL